MNPTLTELLEQADAEIQYPLEGALERVLPWADKFTDHVCLAVMIAEDTIDGEGVGALKREAAIRWMRQIFDRLPLPGVVKMFLGNLFEGAVASLIDLVVKWLNSKFEGNFKGLSGLSSAAVTG